MIGILVCDLYMFVIVVNYVGNVNIFGTVEKQLHTHFTYIYVCIYMYVYIYIHSLHTLVYNNCLSD